MTSPAQARRGRHGIRGLVLLPAFAALAVVLVGLATPANIDAVTKRVTVLTLSVPAKLDLGVHPQVTVRLTADGSAVPGETVSVKIGDQVTKQVTTGPTGSATVLVTRDLSAGTYRFSATFAGSNTFRSSSSLTLTLTVAPVVLAVATVPAMPNMPLLSAGGGAVIKTGADGIALVSVSTIGPLTLKLALPADTPTERIRLDRWDDGSTGATRTVRIPDIRQATVALQFLHPVKFTFNTPSLAPIADSLIPFVDISDDAGNVTRLTGPAPYWIEANAITRLTTGFSSAVPEYRIVSVQLNGSEVVNRGQQRFAADVAKTIPVELLVFDLAIQGRDALLKSSAGFKATVTSTDGIKYFVELDSSGSASVSLPRGEYRIVLGNGIGIPLSTPVALSRDQGVDVLFVTPLDIGLSLAAGLFGAFALVVIGRPHVLGWRSRSDRAGVGAGLTMHADHRTLVRPGITSAAEGTMAVLPVASPTLSWADPTARLSAPERTQRPKTSPPVPIPVGVGEAERRPVGLNGPPGEAIHESPRGEKITRQARIPKRPPTPEPVAKPKPKAGQRPTATRNAATAAKPAPAPKPGKTSRHAAPPTPVGTPAKARPASTSKPRATAIAARPKARTSPESRPGPESTPRPATTPNATRAKAGTVRKPNATLKPAMPAKSPAARNVAVPQPAAPKKSAIRGHAATTRAATPNAAANPGSREAPGPAVKRAATPRPRAAGKVDATPQPGKPATPMPSSKSKAAEPASTSVTQKSRKHATPAPGTLATAKPRKPVATMKPGRLEAAAQPTRPGKLPKPDKPPKSGKPAKPGKPATAALVSPALASGSSPRKGPKPAATAKPGKARRPGA